ncbi:DNAse I-like superfamily protein, partial [Prunus dulcis]
STAKGVRRHGVGPNRSCNEKRYGQKSLSGITVNISKLHLYKPRLCAKRATDFQRVLAPPQSSNGHGTDGVGTTIESPTFYNRHQPRGRPELAGKSCFPTETPGARQKFKRDLREVEAIEVRGIHHRASQSFRTTKGDSAEFSAEV